MSKMTEQNYDEIIKSVKIDLQKMASNDLPIQEAIDLFETNLSKIKTLKQQLDDYKIKVQKVLEDNKIEDFES